ncbi:hypothetical protein C4K21_3001 [Pseudomonas chlororaphis subsp. aurantiaca]|nr:hypothetical protein C4K21_3001 [Pseudomonas chlororaphis subsp. aurantiaca]
MDECARRLNNALRAPCQPRPWPCTGDARKGQRRYKQAEDGAPRWQ